MNLAYELFPAVLNMSITASVATVVIIILRKLFKSMPKVIFYAMWSVVLFRLLVPVSISSDFSFFSVLDMPAFSTGENTSRMEYVPVDIVHTEYPTVDFPVPGVDQIINHFLPQGDEQTYADPLEAPVAIATNLWLAGVFVMIMYGIYTYFKLRKKLVGSVKLSGNIYLSDYITSPFVIGLIRPKIYLPSALAEKEQKYIILHEQHHIKRLDHIVKLLAFTALALHWFNPLVWIAFALLTKDMEMSCDETVVNKLGVAIRSDYSASLLNLATGRHIFAGAPLAFGEGDTTVRIKNLYDLKRPKIIALIAVAAICFVLCISLIVNPDNSRGQILFNGMIYTQNGKAQNSGIVGSRNIGSIVSVENGNAQLTTNLSAKNIESIYEGMPVFQFEEKPEYIYLTTGRGWVPFKAYAMDYDTTESWVKISGTSQQVDIETHFDSNINKFAIYQDIYEFGELLDSSIVMYSNTLGEAEHDTPFNREKTISLSCEYDFFSDNLTTYIHENGITSTFPNISLPDKDYTAWGKNIAAASNRKKILANDSLDVMYIVLSSLANGEIYTDYKSEKNDTVIVYRIVTSSLPAQ